jgi:hypothetical protein
VPGTPGLTINPAPYGGPQPTRTTTMTNDALGAVIICLPLLLWMVI